MEKVRRTCKRCGRTENFPKWERMRDWESIMGGYLCPNCLMDYEDMMYDFLNGHEMEIKREWFDVKDRLPKPGIDVITYREFSSFAPFDRTLIETRVAVTDGEGETHTYWEKNCWGRGKVLYWKFLPVPPDALSCESCRFYDSICDSPCEGKYGYVVGDDFCENYKPRRKSQ